MPRLFFLALLILSCAACGTSVVQPAREAGFRLDDPREIDDATIAQAFAARPQMPAEIGVAYYVFEAADADAVAATLEAVPGVTSTYRIPSLLVSGSRKYDHIHGHRLPPEAEAPSLRQLRLLAARAHADLLVVVDHGHRITRDANGLLALGVAIVPLLFVPWQDVIVESYADSYIIDVRNGYLYGQASAERDGEQTFRTIYSTDAQALVDEQLVELMRDTRSALTQIVEDARTVASEPAKDAPRVAR